MQEGNAVDILLICHVEPGTVRDREIVFHPRHREGIIDAVPRILEFADEANLSMTFAMTATSSKATDSDLDGHEVGVHLHPQDAELGRKLDRKVTLSSDCLSAYSAEDQALLIRSAKEIFEEDLGSSPRTFVAGNWSENDASLKLLLEAGFAFDGSPLPRHTSECADWGRIPRLAQPYNPRAKDYQAAGSMEYLYIPASQGLWGHYVTPEIIHLLGTSYFKAALQEASVGGAEIFHIFFHSPMAIDPFFLAEFREVIEYAQDGLGAGSLLPSACRAGAPSPVKPFPPAYLARLNRRLVKGFVGSGQLGRRLMNLPPGGEA